jgi:hypothetical protein
VGLLPPIPIETTKPEGHGFSRAEKSRAVRRIRSADGPSEGAAGTSDLLFFCTNCIAPPPLQTLSRKIFQLAPSKRDKLTNSSPQPATIEQGASVYMSVGGAQHRRQNVSALL